MEFKEFNTPNKSRGINTCKYIVLHHTGTKEGTAQGNINAFTGKVQLYTSAHYLIDEIGNIYKFGNDKDILWHAGRSEWKGKKDLNKYSIGIELIGPLKNGGFTKAQENSLRELVKDLSNKYNIPIENILRHKDIAPKRKVDVADTLWNDKFKSFEDYKKSLFIKKEPMQVFKVNKLKKIRLKQAFYLTKNLNKKILGLDQRKSKILSGGCTHFSVYNNIGYNSGKSFTYDEIDKNIGLAIKKGILNKETGGNSVKNASFLGKTLKNNFFYINKYKNSEMIDLLLDLGYMLKISIRADKDYSKDHFDNNELNLSYEQYVDGEITVKHSTNIIKENGKYYIFDNYGKRNGNKYRIFDIGSFMTFIAKDDLFCFM